LEGEPSPSALEQVSINDPSVFCYVHLSLNPPSPCR
jgi:hypothetical protein